MIEGEVIEKNEKGGTGEGEAGASLARHRDPEPAGNLQMGGWVEPLWLCCGFHPVLTSHFVRVLGFKVRLQCRSST